MKGKFKTITPIESAARTATGNHLLSNWPANFDEVVGYLDVTAASGTSPTLDLVYEVSPDDGTTWFTHTAFTQATAATSERVVFTRPAGVWARLVYTIGGTTPSFTFSVHLEGKKAGD